MRLERRYLACVLLAGCGGRTEATSESVSPIATEHDGGVAQVATRFYNNPDITMVGYAVPSVGGCTGTMIGPNVMMTASHCGDTDPQIQFRLYQNQDYKQPVSEWFNCHILINTFYHSDITLSFCDPNSQGENPGDKYGYLDFDVSAPSVGESVFSFWFNPIVSLNLSWDSIYSKASVTDTAAVIWGAGGSTDTGPINQPIGIGMSLWTQPGASGSSILNAANDRITAGPTSTGSSDAPGRWALSSKTYFESGSVDGWSDSGGVRHSGVHDAEINSLGLVASNYVGRVDRNSDYLFDVQEDLEQARGENLRDWYYLGFESERRNKLWTTDASEVTFNPTNRTADIRIPVPPLFGGGWEPLSHKHLPLAAATKYRITFMLNTSAASYANGISVGLRKNGIVEASHSISVGVGVGWQMFTFDLDTVSASPDLVFIVNTSLTASLQVVSVIRDDAVMDFDSADKRYNWRNDNNGARALVTPDGESTNGLPNWAALATPDTTRAAGTDLPLRNRQLALVPETDYKICFDVKRQGPSQPNEIDQRIMRVLSAGIVVASVQFMPAADWQTICTAQFTPPTGDNNLQFGFAGPHVSAGYYVDNVRILRQPCGAIENGCGANQQCVNNTCVCEPLPDPCNGGNCGEVEDGCGHMISCGVCRAGLVCDGNECTRPCVPPRCY